MHKPDFHGHSLAVFFAVILSLLFVGSLVTLSVSTVNMSQHGLAIMLLPCAVIFMLLCLTVNRMNVELERQQEQLRYLRYHHMPANVLQTVGLEQGYMVPGKGRSVACSSTPGKSAKATLFTQDGSTDLNATLLPPSQIPPV